MLRRPRIETLEGREVFSAHPLLMPADVPAAANPAPAEAVIEETQLESAMIFDTSQDDGVTGHRLGSVEPKISTDAQTPVDAAYFLERFPNVPLEEFANGVRAEPSGTEAAATNFVVTRPIDKSTPILYAVAVDAVIADEMDFAADRWLPIQHWSHEVISPRDAASGLPSGKVMAGSLFTLDIASAETIALSRFK